MTTKIVKKALIDKDMTQIELAKEIGYSIGALKNAFTNDKYSFEMEYKIKEVLQISQKENLK